MSPRDALFGFRWWDEDTVRIDVAGTVEIGVGVEVGSEDKGPAVVDALLEVSDWRWLHRLTLQALCVG